MTEQQQKPKMLTLPYAKIKHKMSKAETEIQTEVIQLPYAESYTLTDLSRTEKAAQTPSYVELQKLKVPPRSEVDDKK